MENQERNVLWGKADDLIRKGWSDWLPLCDSSIVDLTEFPGVYEVRIKGGNFQRLKGNTSIIYVGCTEKRGLKKRIKGLIKGRHVAKKRISRIKQELKVELEFRFKVDFTARQTEAELLGDFEDKHLELPPCNHNITKK